MTNLFAPGLPAPSLASARKIRIGSSAYPLVLPRLRDSRLHVAGVVNPVSSAIKPRSEPGCSNYKFLSIFLAKSVTVRSYFAAPSR